MCPARAALEMALPLLGSRASLTKQVILMQYQLSLVTLTSLSASLISLRSPWQHGPAVSPSTVSSRPRGDAALGAKCSLDKVVYLLWGGGSLF